jgi:hypothetical protein
VKVRGHHVGPVVYRGARGASCVGVIGRIAGVGIRLPVAIVVHAVLHVEFLDPLDQRNLRQGRAGQLQPHEGGDVLAPAIIGADEIDIDDVFAQRGGSRAVLALQRERRGAERAHGVRGHLVAA